MKRLYIYFFTIVFALAIVLTNSISFAQTQPPVPEVTADPASTTPPVDPAASLSPVPTIDPAASIPPVTPEESAVPIAIDETVISIYHTNDIHGHALPTNNSIGYAKFKQYINEDTAKHKFIFDAGDAFSGDNFANIASGESIADIMKAVGYNEMALGEHDFDYGVKHLDALLQTANLEGSAINIFNKNELEFLPYKMFTAGNFEIGVFGISAPNGETTLPSSNIAGITFLKPEELVAKSQETVNQLKEKGADFVIALSSLGEENSPSSANIATSVTGINLIIDGKSHDSYENGNTTYPGYIEGTTPIIVQAGKNFENFGVVTLKVSQSTNSIISVNASTKNVREMASYDGDAHITQLINQILYEQNQVKREIISNTSVFLNGEEVYTQTGSTSLTRILATAIKEYSGADISIINAGIIQSSLAVGDITVENILNLVANQNYLVKTTVKGSDIIDMLNSTMVFNSEDFPHFAGLNVVAEKYVNIDGINAAAVTSATIDQEPINPEMQYTVITTEDMYSNGYVFSNPIITNYGTIFDVILKYFVATDPEIFEEFSEENRFVITETAVDVPITLEMLALPINAPIKVSLTQMAPVPTIVTQTLKGQDRYFYGNILNNRPYCIYFNGIDIINQGDISLLAAISQEVPLEKRTASSADENAIYLDLSTNTTLPEKSRIKFYVGDIYPPETVLYLYNYDVNNDILEYDINGILVDASGNIDIPISASTVYLINSKLLNAAVFYELPTVQSPYINGIIILFIVFLIWVIIFFIVKKIKKNKVANQSK